MKKSSIFPESREPELFEHPIWSVTFKIKLAFSLSIMHTRVICRDNMAGRQPSPPIPTFSLARWRHAFPNTDARHARVDGAAAPGLHAHTYSSVEA
eukprot:6205562-Pleurochrysis_carterae.AAC.5